MTRLALGLLAKFWLIPAVIIIIIILLLKSLTLSSFLVQRDGANISLWFMPLSVSMVLSSLISAELMLYKFSCVSVMWSCVWQLFVKEFYDDDDKSTCTKGAKYDLFNYMLL